jgi:hypothetical protein
VRYAAYNGSSSTRVSVLCANEYIKAVEQHRGPDHTLNSISAPFNFQLAPKYKRAFLADQAHRVFRCEQTVTQRFRVRETTLREDFRNHTTSFCSPHTHVNHRQITHMLRISIYGQAHSEASAECCQALHHAEQNSCAFSGFLCCVVVLARRCMRKKALKQ